MRMSNAVSGRPLGSLLVAFLAAAVSTGYAATYSCTGKVTQVATVASGEVNASFLFSTGNMLRQRVCNIDQAIDGISVSSCKGMLAALLAAQLSQSAVTIWFDNASGNSCSATSWGALHDLGWYWGPSVE